MDDIQSDDEFERDMEELRTLGWQIFSTHYAD